MDACAAEDPVIVTSCWHMSLDNVLFHLPRAKWSCFRDYCTYKGFETFECFFLCNVGIPCSSKFHLHVSTEVAPTPP